MLRKGLVLAILVVVVSGVIFLSTIPEQVMAKTFIPDWVKQVAEFWVADQIDDSGFVQVIEYLVQEEIITIPYAEAPEEETAIGIPIWIKSSAEFWVKGDISDDEFATALEWLINNGIIKVKQTVQTLALDCSGNAGCFEGYVTKIVDGDTIYTASLKIRLSLTNTPEKYQDGFSEATEFTKKLCPVGSQILVDQDDLQRVDKYGRVLAKVFCGDKILNSELLYNGHANILTQYCSTSEFSGEAWAQKHGCSSDEPPKFEAATPKQRCDPSYPDVCIDAYPPDLDCGDISYKNFRVVGSDPHGFDGDGDGIGCES